MCWWSSSLGYYTFWDGRRGQVPRPAWRMRPSVPSWRSQSIHKPSLDMVWESKLQQRERITPRRDFRRGEKRAGHAFIPNLVPNAEHRSTFTRVFSFHSFLALPCLALPCVRFKFKRTCGIRDRYKDYKVQSHNHKFSQTWPFFFLLVLSTQLPPATSFAVVLFVFSYCWIHNCTTRARSPLKRAYKQTKGFYLLASY